MILLRAQPCLMTKRCDCTLQLHCECTSIFLNKIQSSEKRICIEKTNLAAFVNYFSLAYRDVSHTMTFHPFKDVVIYRLTIELHTRSANGKVKQVIIYSRLHYVKPWAYTTW